MLGAFQPQVRKALDKNHVFIRDSRQRCWSCRPAGEHALLHEHGQTEDGPDEPPFLGLLLSPGEQFSLFSLPGSSAVAWPELALSGNTITTFSANGCILHDNESNFFCRVYFIYAK